MVENLFWSVVEIPNNTLHSSSMKLSKDLHLECGRNVHL